MKNDNGWIEDGAPNPDDPWLNELLAALAMLKDAVDGGAVLHVERATTPPGQSQRWCAELESSTGARYSTATGNPMFVCLELARQWVATRERDEIKRFGNVPPELKQPRIGWEQGYQHLARGRCPYCSHPIQNISIHPTHGITWACFDGCNP